MDETYDAVLVDYFGLKKGLLPERHDRPWGFWVITVDPPHARHKLLFVKPGQATSLQRHFERDEVLTVITGEMMLVKSRLKDPTDEPSVSVYCPGHSACVEKSEWHKIINPHEQQWLVISEVQLGKTYEHDIEKY